MTQRKNLVAQPVQSGSLTKRMIIGGSIALLVMIIFLAGANDPNPEWGKFWMIRPLIIVALAGAFGGAFSYFMLPWQKQGGWKMISALALGFIVYLIALWLGTVLGLDGTYWN